MGAGGDGAVRPAPEALTVGCHAPPPGAHTGVADYAAALERALGKFAKIERGTAQADVHLYHLGNNRLHEQIYLRALEVPGVIVLHDAVLNHFMLSVLSEREYVAEFVYNYGAWRRDLGRELWLDRASSGMDLRYFRYPMLRRIAERSRGAIVHNKGAAAVVREVAAELPVFVIPHLAASSGAAKGEGDAFRKQIGVDAGAVLFGIFGYLRETKRIPACMAAFRRLRAVRPDTALLLAGKVVSEDLARLLEFEAADTAIRRVERLDSRRFAAAIAAVDCCVNLRYPGAGETSGIAIHAMSAAKPVILTDSDENSDYPVETCLRVLPAAAEITELFDCMSLVTEFPDLAREMGRAAERRIRSVHAPERVATLYIQALEEVAERRVSV